MLGCHKIVLIGAGSREFSRGLIHDLIIEKDLAGKNIELVLVDINETVLNDILVYAQLAVREMGIKHLICSATTDRERALINADFVLLSIAIHRMDLWEQDFRVPYSFGIRHTYGENGGPGAMFHALRNFKILMPICDDISRICPDAYVFNFTNPEARVLTLIRSVTNLNAYGLCHGFYSLRGRVSTVLDRSIDELDIRSAGMNHFYTFYKINDLKTGKNLIPLFKDKLNSNLEQLEPLVRFMWETFGILGYGSDHHIGEYIPYAEEFSGCRWEFGVENRAVPSQFGHVDGRTAFNAWRFNMDITSFLNSDVMVEEDKKNDIKYFKKENVEYSGELAIPVIADIILDRKNWRPALNMLNTDLNISNLDKTGCIEVPAMVDAEGIHPENVGVLPEAFASMIRTQHAIQRLIVQAYTQKSKDLLYQALLLDPLVHSAEAARKILETMLELQKEYLPEFN